MEEGVERLEPRVIRLESDMAHLIIQSADIKAGLHQLNEKMDARFDRVDEKFDRVDERFEKVNERFERVDERFERVDERFTALLEKLGELKVWAIVVIGGGVLSVVARALHWL